MPLSEKEVLQVLELFEKSGWEDLQLQSGDISLRISKTGRLLANPAATLSPARVDMPVPVAAQTAAPVAAPAPAAVDPRWVAVKAPLLGHFYAAPKPGAPPFVTVGQQVGADDTVAILEVMKLMNHVKAGVTGRIARIAVANGDLVEYEQPLLYIDPSA